MAAISESELNKIADQIANQMRNDDSPALVAAASTLADVLGPKETDPKEKPVEDPRPTVSDPSLCADHERLRAEKKLAMLGNTTDRKARINRLAAIIAEQVNTDQPAEDVAAEEIAIEELKDSRLVIGCGETKIYQ